tara:strand:- start:15568 stop:15873 length:306 start_codon:yes stop_codon:yes gene_type:complete
MIICFCKCKICLYENKNGLYWTKKKIPENTFIKWKKTSLISWTGYDASNKLYCIKYIWGSNYIRLDGQYANYKNVSRLLIWFINLTNYIDRKIRFYFNLEV